MSDMIFWAPQGYIKAKYISTSGCVITTGRWRHYDRHHPLPLSIDGQAYQRRLRSRRRRGGVGQ